MLNINYNIKIEFQKIRVISIIYIDHKKIDRNKNYTIFKKLIIQNILFYLT